MAEPLERAFFLHVGTHKTGTTSIQVFLADNAEPLRSAGILVPLAGRPTSKWGSRCGHHNAAWGLNEIAIYDPKDGSFEDILQEAARSGNDSVVVSSEEFEYLHARPNVLEAIADGVRRAGYVPVAILYLRTQAEYLQSTYAEGAKAGYVPGFSYRRLVDEILRTGAYVPDPKVVVRLDYLRLADAFASAFGSDRVVVRGYQPAEPTVILREFLGIVAPHGLAANLRAPGALNVSPSLTAVLAEMHRALAVSNPRFPSPAEVASSIGQADLGFSDSKFDVLTNDEARIIAERFAGDNAALESRYGVRLPPAKALGRVDADPAEIAARHQRALLFACLDAWNVSP